MKRIIFYFACVAMVIGFVACSGSGNSNSKESKDSGEYKEPFAFLEATLKGETGLYDTGTQGVISKTSYFKKEETPAQKEILDKMMAGVEKKVAKVATKTFFNNGRVGLGFFNVSISNGADIKDKDGDFLSNVSLEDFPEIGYPFEKYYVILDKAGNIARLVADRSSYSWELERTAAKAKVQRNFPWGIDGVPKKVVEGRKKFWSNGGTPESDTYII